MPPSRKSSLPVCWRKAFTSLASFTRWCRMALPAFALRSVLRIRGKIWNLQSMLSRKRMRSCGNVSTERRHALHGYRTFQRGRHSRNLSPLSRKRATDARWSKIRLQLDRYRTECLLSDHGNRGRRALRAVDRELGRLGGIRNRPGADVGRDGGDCCDIKKLKGGYNARKQ